MNGKDGLIYIFCSIDELFDKCIEIEKIKYIHNLTKTHDTMHLFRVSKIDGNRYLFAFVNNKNRNKTIKYEYKNNEFLYIDYSKFIELEKELVKQTKIFINNPKKLVNEVICNHNSLLNYKKAEKEKEQKIKRNKQKALNFNKKIRRAGNENDPRYYANMGVVRPKPGEKAGPGPRAKGRKYVANNSWNANNPISSGRGNF